MGSELDLHAIEARYRDSNFHVTPLVRGDALALVARIRELEAENDFAYTALGRWQDFATRVMRAAGMLGDLTRPDDTRAREWMEARLTLSGKLPNSEIRQSTGTEGGSDGE